MKVILFGATGMIGQGVLRECLLDPGVEGVLSVGRTPLSEKNPKLHELVTSDLMNLSSYEADLTGYEACFFCLGTSSAGKSEENYKLVTYNLTVSAAQTLLRFNRTLVFIYVSGAGTDSTERGRIMWARVKGQTENALLRMPFKAAYMFRIGIVQPLHGIKSKTKLYNFFYIALSPVLSVLQKLFPRQIVTTEQVGRAMLTLVREGNPKSILENSDISGL
jgi:uncharacterized protein YbjT (DUF2867 family)